MRTSDKTDLIDAAMALVQAAIDETPTATPKRTKTATVQGETAKGKDFSYNYNYADLPSVLRAIRPLLAKHEIALFQGPKIEAGAMILVTRLACKGQWIECDYIIGAVSLKHTDIGKGVTYSRRYSLMAMCGIMAADEDTDAAEVSTGLGKDGKPAAEPISMTKAMTAITIAETGAELKAWAADKTNIDPEWTNAQHNAVMRHFKDRVAALKSRASEAAAEAKRAETQRNAHVAAEARAAFPDRQPAVGGGDFTVDLDDEIPF